MRLVRIYARSFGPFNYDYTSPLTDLPRDQVPPWEVDDSGEVRPHVSVPIDAHLTALVGANESGKSQLLEALLQVVSPKLLKKSHLCRYSLDADTTPGQFGSHSIGTAWAIDAGELNALWQLISTSEAEETPDASAETFALDTEGGAEPPEEAEELQAAAEASPAGEGEVATPALPTAPAADQMIVFRTGRANYDGYRVYLTNQGTSVYFSEIKPDVVPSLLRLLPAVEKVGREEGFPLMANLKSLLRCGSVDRDEAIGEDSAFVSEEDWDAHEPTAQDRLVYQLLVGVCGYKDIDLMELLLDEEQMKDMFGASLTEQVNKELALSERWHQDTDVELVVSVQGETARFLIRDKTGKTYALAERSQGLRYFMSFLIRTLTKTKNLALGGIMVFDEPDYALSVVGQRDLLTVFKAIAQGTLTLSKHQVIYTTHSPYLIDRNRPSRVVGLLRGPYDEGTVVIERAHGMFYEPIRTALGVPHAYSLFLDVPNLLVEGVSDLEYIVGTSRYLASLDRPHLDLNTLELIVAGGASYMPKLLRSAFVHPQARPYVTVLLDNDERAVAVRQEISNSPELAHLEEEKQVIDIHSVLPGLQGEAATIEDLIPLDLYRTLFIRAHSPQWPDCAQYVDEHLPALYDSLRTVASSFKALVAQANETGTTSGVEYDKVAVARHLSEYLQDSELEDSEDSRRFVSAIERLHSLLGNAVKTNADTMMHRKVLSSITRQIRDFIRLRKHPPAKNAAVAFLDSLLGLAVGVGGHDGFVRAVGKLKQEHGLDRPDDSDVVPRYDQFVAALRGLPSSFRYDRAAVA